MSAFLDKADLINFDPGNLQRLMGGVGTAVLVAVGLPLFFLLIAGIAGGLVQHKPVWTFEPLAPKANRIDPIQGWNRIFSKESMVTLLKGVLKITGVGAIMVLVLWPKRATLDTLVRLDVASLLPATLDLTISLMIGVMIAMTLIAGIDFAWQRHQWWQRQRMTVEELKEEFKSSEGSPEVKAKLRQLRKEKSRKRMMADVPNASVVITNPTHYAVALRFEKGMNAPICVAKGVDLIAQKIREVASQHEIPLVENPPLARALHATVEIDDEIPEEHYKAVAQVIGYVMTLKQRMGWKS